MNSGWKLMNFCLLWTWWEKSSRSVIIFHLITESNVRFQFRYLFIKVSTSLCDTIIADHEPTTKSSSPKPRSKFTFFFKCQSDSIHFQRKVIFSVENEMKRDWRWGWKGNCFTNMEIGRTVEFFSWGAGGGVKKDQLKINCMG